MDGWLSRGWIDMDGWMSSLCIVSCGHVYGRMICMHVLTHPPTHTHTPTHARTHAQGNFLMLEQCVEDFSADATRFALADAGKGVGGRRDTPRMYIHVVCPRTYVAGVYTCV
jgi:hypothetical protein